jgi:prepilin-type N-terminal cleavage/methylation domain-containing protein
MKNATSMRGYTLLEMIVAVGIFAIVMLAATGAYLSLIQLDRHARAVNDVANNLSFAVDSMARSIRTGSDYDCTPGQGGANCWGGTPGTSFGFNDSETPSRSVVYALSNGQITASINGGTAIPLTDPRITVSALEFRVNGVGTGDQMQPHVIFNVRGTMTTSAQASTTFSIQGSATSRYLEL